MLPQSLAYQNWSRIWNMILPNLPAAARTAAPPLVYFGRSQVPVAAQSAPNLQRGGAQLGPFPGAGYMGGPYTGRAFALPQPAAYFANISEGPSRGTFQQLRQRTSALDQLLHETAHTVQSPEVVNMPTMAEGGADALALLLREQAARQFGIPGLPPYWGYAHAQQPFNPTTNRGAYAPADQGSWFLKTFGRQYALRGQFNPRAHPPVIGFPPSQARP